MFEQKYEKHCGRKDIFLPVKCGTGCDEIYKNMIVARKKKKQIRGITIV